MDLRRLDGFARTHHGLVTRAAAASVGVSRSAWYRALDRGVLEHCFPNVARMPGAPRTVEQRALAAVLATGRGAIASHRTAARLLGVDRPDRDPIDVTVPDRRFVQLPGVVVHRPTDRADLRPTVRAGVACTNELRTLCDLGAVAPESVSAALELFITRGAVTPAAVVALLKPGRHGRSGRAGIGALRAALAEWPLGDAIPDSQLEVAMARLVRRHGLPAVTFHARVAGFEVDFLIDASPIVIECDGWSTHVADRNQWEFDLDRGAALASAGYVVLHRSRGQIVHHPHDTAQRIVALVRRWAPTLLQAG